MSIKQGEIDEILRLLRGGIAAGASVVGTTFGYAGGLGWRITRPAFADPAAFTTIFTIAGGPILVTHLSAYRTIIQAGGAGNITFRHSVGPTALDSTVTVTTGDNVGTTYTVPFDPAEPCIIGLNGAPAVPSPIVATSTFYGSLPIRILGPGNIQVDHNVTTGSCQYALCYIPLSDAVTVIAV